ncbi:hypothetical protein ACR79B_22755, partial [Sphingobacterium spiritivorum]
STSLPYEHLSLKGSELIRFNSLVFSGASIRLCLYAVAGMDTDKRSWRVCCCPHQQQHIVSTSLPYEHLSLKGSELIRFNSLVFSGASIRLCLYPVAGMDTHKHS